MAELKTIHEIRLSNTRKLMKESGLNRTEFAEKIDMSYNLLSQYVGKNPTKNIGDDTAEKIEKAFNKPKGYLDQSDSESIQNLGSFNKLDIEAFKKQHNITDNADAVRFSNTTEMLLPTRKRWVPVKACSLPHR